MRIKDLSDIIADALVSAKLVDEEKFKKASEIIAEEINARLALNDWIELD